MWLLIDWPPDDSWITGWLINKHVITHWLASWWQLSYWLTDTLTCDYSFTRLHSHPGSHNYYTFWIKSQWSDSLQICLSSVLTTSGILQEAFVIDWLIGGCVLDGILAWYKWHSDCLFDWLSGLHCTCQLSVAVSKWPPDWFKGCLTIWLINLCWITDWCTDSRAGRLAEQQWFILTDWSTDSRDGWLTD